MAPIQKRISIRTQASQSSSETSLQRTSRYPAKEETFRSTKDDKRRMKHSSLISRIEKSRPKVQKRRRPSKKLITTLESLANALPETDGNDERETIVDNVRIKHKSLKSRPGAMKKKAKLEDMEKERFSKNLVQMANFNAVAQGVGLGTASSTGEAGDSSKRWAALRGFIQSTMDRDA